MRILLTTILAALLPMAPSAGQETEHDPRTVLTLDGCGISWCSQSAGELSPFPAKKLLGTNVLMYHTFLCSNGEVAREVARELRYSPLFSEMVYSLGLFRIETPTWKCEWQAEMQSVQLLGLVPSVDTVKWQEPYFGVLVDVNYPLGVIWRNGRFLYFQFLEVEPPRSLNPE